MIDAKINEIKVRKDLFKWIVHFAGLVLWEIIIVLEIVHVFSANVRPQLQFHSNFQFSLEHLLHQ